MKTEKELRTFFDNELRKYLLPLEEYRIKKITQLKHFLLSGLALYIIAIFCIINIWVLTAISLIIIGLIVWGFAFQTYYTMKSTLRKEFKYKILPILLTYLFDNFEYIPNQKIAKSVFIKSKLFTEDITRVLGEDFMRFRLGETGIMFCEADVYKFGRNETAFFHGIFIGATFNKYFSKETIVLPKQLNSFWQFIKRRIFDGFELIKLEDGIFNNEFNVYGTDQIESRYILSPSLMERLIEYKTKTKKGISFSFTDNRMYCLIPNYTNLFEPVLFETFLNFEFILKNYKPLKLYTDIVDNLNLNLRIWSKQ